MKRSLLLFCVFAGCSHLNGGYRSEEPVGAGALSCAAGVMDDLHYRVGPSQDPLNSAVRGEKILYVPSGRPTRSVAELTASLISDRSGATYLRVDANRYEIGQEGIDLPALGGGGTGVGGTPVPRDPDAPESARDDRGRRVALGPVGGDAGQVIRACGSSEGSLARSGS
jgi:hypothetical protein